jgi:hypothetical protein
MKHSDPVDTTDGPATSPSSSSSSVSSHMNGGAAVSPNETLLNALRLHHLSVVRQDEARRRRGGGLLATTPPSSLPSPRRSQDDDDDIYSSSMSWLSSPSSPSIGFSPRHSQHPGASPPASMNGVWGGPTAGGRRESAALQDTRRRHLLGILTAALDELSDGSLEMDPLDGEADDLDDE